MVSVFHFFFLTPQSLGHERANNMSEWCEIETCCRKEKLSDWCFILAIGCVWESLALEGLSGQIGATLAAEVLKE